MNRRSFLSSLLAASAALALDPEKLLWVPGQRTIFIPSFSGSQFLTVEWITQEALRALRENIKFARYIDRDYASQLDVGATLIVRTPPLYRGRFSLPNV